MIQTVTQETEAGIIDQIETAHPEDHPETTKARQEAADHQEALKITAETMDHQATQEDLKGTTHVAQTEEIQTETLQEDQEIHHLTPHNLKKISQTRTHHPRTVILDHRNTPTIQMKRKTYQRLTRKAHKSLPSGKRSKPRKLNKGNTSQI
jgi:hypothetical protein